MANQLKSVRQKAFTLVELVIVIAIVGILATISIVSYNSLQQQARAKVALSDLDGAVSTLELKLAKDGVYPTVTTDLLASKGTTYQYSYDNAPTVKTYCITATNSNVSYYASSASTTLAPGGCPGHGVNGVPPITNIATNPGFEGSLSQATGTNASLALDSNWSATGSYSALVTPNSSSSNDSYFNYGGDVGGLRMGMLPGKTYTISATIRLSAPLTSTFGSNGARQITAWYTNGGTNTLLRSNQAANAAGTTRLSVTMSIPSTATAAWLRFYHGGFLNSGTVNFDNIMITEGNTVYAHRDGMFTSSGWAWNGNANLSTSSGPAP